MGFHFLTSVIWTILTISSYNSDADIDINFSSDDDDDNHDTGKEENVDKYGDYWDDLIDENICAR